MSAGATALLPGGEDQTARPGAHLRISVVISAHALDRWHVLEMSVGSVRDQTHPAHEVFVAIDHNDELLERARRAFPGVRVIASDGAPGASGARNTAIRRATGHIVAFIDDDARADRHWLEAIARAHADPRVIGTCGQIVPLSQSDREGRSGTMEKISRSSAGRMPPSSTGVSSSVRFSGRV